MTSTIVTHTTTYNLLDLPQQETVGSTIVIDRKYGADGTKLQEKVTTSGSSVLTRDYIGNLIYENGTLKKILFDGGYVDMTGSAPAYRFFLTDHLGSVRVVAAADGTVMQVNHYYPYGGLMIDPRHTISSPAASDSRYRFIGKELSEESGEYDFGARYLDPIPGRFTTLDPLAEKYYSLSPYAYCAGNPMSFVDPDGRDTVYVIDSPVRPMDSGRPGTSYSADIYYVHNGVFSPVYRGSSYPNSRSNSDNTTMYNTVKEGEYNYNNQIGHKGGTQKGLNLINESGKRSVPAYDPQGNDITATNVNVHSGASDRGNYNSRGSQACITIHPEDAEAFFSNFNWTNTQKTVGNSSGMIIIIRSDEEKEYFRNNAF